MPGRDHKREPLTILHGEALAMLKTLPDNSVQCAVTSPPYYGLRDYSACSCAQQRHTSESSLEWCRTKVPGASGQSSPTDPRCKKEPDPDCPHCQGTGKIPGVAEHQLGLEKTPEEYIAKLVAVFREVRRVLRHDAVLWVNLGDSYSSQPGQRVQSVEGRNDTVGWKQETNRGSHAVGSRSVPWLKPKDLIEVPWMLAFALRADGWYLRSEIIWHKKNCMPESVTDRPTKAHEQIFLLSKSATYFYDHVAILEPISLSSHARISQDLQQQIGTFRANGGGKAKVNGPNSRMARERTPEGDDGKPNPSSWNTRPKTVAPGTGVKNNESFDAALSMPVAARNKRDVWLVGTEPFKGAHFAVFPSELIKPCILAGTSAKGCCAQCGAPWERVVEDGPVLEDWKKASGADQNGEYHGRNQKDYQSHLAQPASTVKERILAGMTEKKTTGWQPTCECHGRFVRGKRVVESDTSTWNGSKFDDGKNEETHPNVGKNRQPKEMPCWIYEPSIPLLDHPVAPCTVLDPFLGSGTTAQVALELGRHCIGIELNASYLPLIRQRCTITPGLPLA